MKIKLYFKQAWAMLQQNKLFSMLYVVGTGLAIAMTMVMAIIYYVRMAPMYPEPNRLNTLYLRQLSAEKNQEGNHNIVSWSYSYDALQEWFYPMKTPREVSARLMDNMSWNSYIQPADRSGDFLVAPFLTDPAFFHIYSLSFLEGKPFTQADLESGVPTAVITDDLARRLYGTAEGVVGRTFSLNFSEYSVCGVVRAGSYLMSDSYSQLYLPYTVSPAYRRNPYGMPYVGAYQLTFLAEDGQADAVIAEVAELERRYNLAHEKDWQVDFKGGAVTHVRSVLENGENDLKGVMGRLCMLVLVLLLVPALNLSGMIAGRMEGRLVEMGVRKSFGACRGVLLRQVMWENLLLTLLGGALGLLLAWLGIYVGREWVFSVIDAWPSDTPQGTEVRMYGEMLFAPLVFMAALLLCLAINLLSALIPAWHSLRHPIVKSLLEKR